MEKQIIIHVFVGKKVRLVRVYQNDMTTAMTSALTRVPKCRKTYFFIFYEITYESSIKY